MAEIELMHYLTADSATGGSIVAYIALGSNLGERLNFLRQGRTGLEQRGVRIQVSSAVYRTEPVGGPQAQQEYYNAVLQVEVGCSALDLLHICQAEELAAGRTRQERWGSRTLDIDILLFGGQRIDTEELQVPHPRMFERRFVLEPLARIAPNMIPPGSTEDIVTVLRRLPDSPKVVKILDYW